MLIACCWGLLGAGMVVLLLASTRVRQNEQCAAVEVRITSAAAVLHFSKEDVLRKISGNHPELLVGAPVRTFDLRQLEQLLEQDLWVRNAELYFDHNKTLHVLIEERRPVARVFTDAGTTFYVDDMGMQLPISSQAAHVPVFTSFPTNGRKQPDSTLLMQVRDMGLFLMGHDFWQAQIEQVHMNGAEMELIPKLGMHTIVFGTATDVPQKFKRLELFYERVLRKVGWNFYSTLDLRFDKQLVATRRDSASLFASYVLPRDLLALPNHGDSLVTSKADSLTAQTTAAVNTTPMAEPKAEASKEVAASEKKQSEWQPPAVEKGRQPTTRPSAATLPGEATKKEMEVVKEAVQSANPTNTNRQPKAVMPKRQTQQP